ncbi:MAG: fused response regulator/phosphatase [Pseudomonadota bacterium]
MGDSVLNVAREFPQAAALVGAARQVLVVDDSRAQRHLVAVQLRRWGYDVVEAATGDAALSLCAATAFDIVISDWMMPGMTGPDFCRAFRALPRDGYGYFILLTSNSEKGAIADGLEAGADDFLTKPVAAAEMRARLRAGERILGMQAELVEKNREIGAKMHELRCVHDSLDRDLIEARKLQQTLVRERHHDFGSGTVSLLVRPSGHVGGDLVGVFRIDATRIALYAVDVSGHGVAAAMMTARLAGLFSSNVPEQNIALMRDGDQITARPPHEVATRLNRMMIDEFRVDQYLTLAFAEIDLTTGRVRLVQAGHPHPVLLRQAGFVGTVGEGGFPIGLLPDAEYRSVEFRMAPGDRLLIPSDGFTECPGATGDLGEAGMIRLLRGKAALAGPDLLDGLVDDLAIHAGGADFGDDLSAVLFDYRGAPDSAAASIALSPSFPNS